MGALEEPGDLGEQICPAAGELAQFGHCGGLLGGGELAPLRMMPGLVVELREEDPVSLRAVVEHVFRYHKWSGDLSPDTTWLRDYVIFVLPAHRSGL